jgi:pilus assembly protein TadC
MSSKKATPHRNIHKHQKAVELEHNVAAQDVSIKQPETTPSPQAVKNEQERALAHSKAAMENLLTSVKSTFSRPTQYHEKPHNKSAFKLPQSKTFDKQLELLQLMLLSCDIEVDAKKFIIWVLAYGAALGIGIGLIFLPTDVGIALFAAVLTFVLFAIVILALLAVTANKRIALIEEALPDFLSFMASNIRSGITYDRALLLSARKELGPLSKEIDRAAKETLGGTPFTEALMSMTLRINSNTFSRTMRLIVEGINSGGNLADLLENTALDLRNFEAIRRDVSATVFAYELFMFAAAAIGAPLIYAVTTFLIKIIAQTREKIGVDTNVTSYLPLMKGTASVSPDLVFWFSMGAMLITAVCASLAAGVISKGKESEGYPFVPI